MVDIIEKEIESNIRKDVHGFKNKIKKIANENRCYHVKKSLMDKFLEECDKLSDYICLEFKQYHDGITDEKLESSRVSLKKVMDLYFSGDCPFFLAQEKKEFPDAIICLALEDFMKDKADDEIYIISNDDAIIEYCNENPTLQSQKSLEDFFDKRYEDMNLVNYKRIKDHMQAICDSGEIWKDLKPIVDDKLILIPSDEYVEGEIIEQEIKEFRLDSFDVVEIIDTQFSTSKIILKFSIEVHYQIRYYPEEQCFYDHEENKNYYFDADIDNDIRVFNAEALITLNIADLDEIVIDEIDILAHEYTIERYGYEQSR